MDGVPNFEAVVFRNELMGCTAGWAIGTDLVACTVDGGVNWRVQEIKSTPLGIILGKNGQAYIVGKNGANLVSKDFGKSWQRYEAPNSLREKLP